MSVVKRKAEVLEEKRTSEALAPPPVDIPQYEPLFDIDLLIMRDGQLVLEPEQGRHLWFAFEIHRVFPDKGEIIGFLRRTPVPEQADEDVAPSE